MVNKESAKRPNRDVQTGRLKAQRPVATPAFTYHFIRSDSTKKSLLYYAYVSCNFITQFYNRTLSLYQVLYCQNPFLKKVDMKVPPF